MATPLVRCAGCARAWHSPTMADGLRLVDGCPRCGGTLVFADAVPDQGVVPGARTAPQDGLAPHLVLGVPRR